MTTRHYVETIDGAELLVSYNYKKQPANMEEFHGYHYFDNSSIILKSVEVVIAGVGIDITDQLTDSQIKKIIRELKIDE